MKKKLMNMWTTAIVVLLIFSLVAAAAVEGLWRDYAPQMLKFFVRNVFRTSDLLPIEVGEKEWIHPDHAVSAGIMSAMANLVVVWWLMAAYRTVELILCAVMAGGEVLLHEFNTHRPQFRTAS